MKLLITGIPGMGKTTVGNHLQSRYRYEHLDMEALPGRSPDQCIETFLATPGDNKVITWGFVPGVSNQGVQYFQQLGFSMIWFDGNRNVARKAFLKRGTVPEHLFDLQMERINSLDLSIFNPAMINTFDEQGNHLELDVIVSRILEKVRHNPG